MLVSTLQWVSDGYCWSIVETKSEKSQLICFFYFWETFLLEHKLVLSLNDSQLILKVLKLTENIIATTMSIFQEWLWLLEFFLT